MSLADHVEMIEVPVGRYLVGVADGVPRLAKPPQYTWPGYPLASPQSWIDIAKPFRISRDLLSYAQVRVFGGIATDGGDDTTAELAIDDALTVAQLAGAALPTWYEWEIAARGPQPFLYPWGDTFDLARIETRSKWYSMDEESTMGYYTNDQEIVLLENWGGYAHARSPFGLDGLVRVGVEWNLADLRLTNEPYVVRSHCDVGAMLYMVPNIRPWSFGRITNVERPFSGPISACFGLPAVPERVLYKKAAFRLVQH